MSGRVVRLTRGEIDNQKIYGEPLEVVKQWAEMGAEMIHIVDLDAALGCGSNSKLIEKIIADSPSPIQLGGGIRSIEAASHLLRKGAARIILGSLAFKDPEAITKIIDRYGSKRVVVSLDNLAGLVKISGWQEKTQFSVDEALDNCREKGAELFLITSIERDGTLTSPDIETVRRLSTRARVIAAGGVSTLSDLTSLSRAGAEAVIVGKALYEVCFSFSEAMEAAK
jgi:phosphoribosylformimino-5-aminoimidazole carboxamide ribotide isomerase